jgi:hypothetical protein
VGSDIFPKFNHLFIFYKECGLNSFSGAQRMKYLTDMRNIEWSEGSNSRQISRRKVNFSC